MKEIFYNYMGQNGANLIMIFPKGRIFGDEKRKSKLKIGDVVMFHDNMCRTFIIETEEDIKDVLYGDHLCDLYKEYNIQHF